MAPSETDITPTSDSINTLLSMFVIYLYEMEADICHLPELIFDIIPRMIGCDAVGYTEVHHRSGDFRYRLSIDDDPERRMALIEAFARHRHSHPFWAADPGFFGDRALRDTDFFSDEEYLSLPIATEVFLPSNTRHFMSVVIAHENYSLTLSLHRLLGRPAFSDTERDLLQGFRPHVLRIYRQAQQRAIAALGPVDRLRVAYPDLTPRQIEVADWLIQGKANEDIALILGIGVDTVKAHVKAIYRKVGSESRLALARAAFTAIPFAELPPLWTFDDGVRPLQKSRKEISQPAS